MAGHPRAAALGHAAGRRDRARDAVRPAPPLTAAELGVDPVLYRRAVGGAHELRDRYCFLDLAAQSGGSRTSWPARADGRERASRSRTRSSSPLTTVLDLLSTDEQRRTRIAWLYYVEGLTQAEIADRLGVSRVKVVRDLQIGRADRAWSRSRSTAAWPPASRWSAGWSAASALKEAVVVPTPHDPAHLPATLGIALGSWLSDRLRAGQTVGVGWGRTLHWSVRALRRRDLPGLTVVALLGGIGRGSEINMYETASRVAETLGAQCYYLAAPAFAARPPCATCCWPRRACATCSTAPAAPTSRWSASARSAPAPPTAASACSATRRPPSSTAARRRRRPALHLPRRRRPPGRPSPQRLLGRPPRPRPATATRRRPGLGRAGEGAGDPRRAGRRLRQPPDHRRAHRRSADDLGVKSLPMRAFCATIWALAQPGAARCRSLPRPPSPKPPA